MHRTLSVNISFLFVRGCECMRNKVGTEDVQVERLLLGVDADLLHPLRPDVIIELVLELVGEFVDEPVVLDGVVKRQDQGFASENDGH